ncbi:hypothetical protein GCM10008915_11050 [Bifidobacterium pullorum subsp. gallinarum]
MYHSRELAPLNIQTIIFTNRWSVYIIKIQNIQIGGEGDGTISSHAGFAYIVSDAGLGRVGLHE